MRKWPEPRTPAPRAAPAGPPKSAGDHFDKTVEHPLRAGMIEIDLQLIAVDAGDDTRAELAVEDLRSHRDITAALQPDRNRAGAHIECRGPAAAAKRRLAKAALPGGAGPAGTASGTARDIAERITAPAGASAYNPAFDVTPAHLIRGLITEHGVISPVTTEEIRRVLGASG